MPAFSPAENLPPQRLYLHAALPARTLPRRWFSFLAILRQHRIRLFGCQVFVKLVVHLERRRPATSSNALHLFQRKLSVCGPLLVTDAERLLAVLQKFFAAAQQATDVGADLHVVLAHGLGVEHGVVTDHVAHFKLAQFHPLGDLLNDFLREIPDLILRIKQHRHQRCAPRGIATVLHLREALLELVGKFHFAFLFYIPSGPAKRDQRGSPIATRHSGQL